MTEQPDSFEITWRGGAYYVSIPNYQGGTVYTADHVERLQRRVRVLEMVIDEELDAYDCADDANRMIVEGVRDKARRAVGPPRESGK